MTPGHLQPIGDVALVTGAAGGVGRAVTTALRGAGVSTVYGWDRVPGCGDHVLEQVIDLADPAHVEDALHSMPRTPGIVVHAAGAYVERPGFDFAADRLRRTLEVDVVSAFIVHREIARRLGEAGKPGAFVNIVSIAGKRGFPRQADYVASKAALIGLTRAGALDLSPSITVNGIAPGAVDTPMIDQVLSDIASGTRRPLPEQREALTAEIPTGRMQRPDEIAAAVVFLTSTAARSINGEILTIDGGVSRD